MSYIFLQEQGEVSSVECFSDIPAYVLSRLNLTCQKVLLQRQRDGILPKFPIWDDVRTFDGKPWRGSVDVVCGGFPCQDISSAGKGAGLNGARSGLWREMRRLVCEIRPSIVFVENSPMLTIRGLGIVLADLASLGFNARWDVFGACDIGADHKRKRIWILAYAAESGLKFSKLLNNREKRASNHACEHLENDSQLLTKSGVLRNDYALAERMDRLAAIGNGQVPAVVKLAWETLSA